MRRNSYMTLIKELTISTHSSWIFHGSSESVLPSFQFHFISLVLILLLKSVLWFSALVLEFCGNQFFDFHCCSNEWLGFWFWEYRTRLQTVSLFLFVSLFIVYFLLYFSYMHSFTVNFWVRFSQNILDNFFDLIFFYILLLFYI